jgi:RNA polymerase subunit RPABC4/transcription elongation factor Spt4
MAKVKEKACKICKKIYEEGDKCPRCESKESTESFKGRLYIIDSKKSVIAQNLNIAGEGEFAIKTR